MNTTRILTVILATALLARADVLPPSQDTSSLKGKLTAVTGKAATLAVSATRSAYVQFDLGNLPADVQAADIASARLRIYFTKVTKPGDITIALPAQAWDETAAASPPGVAGALTVFFPTAAVVGKKFVEVDVTSTVQAWRAGTVGNFGFSLQAGGITSVLIGAKEGSGTGYPCELVVDIARAGTIADGSIGTVQLADAAITNVKLANSTITVTAGSGLTGGGSVSLGGSVTLSLGASLTLGGTTTVSGGLDLPATTSGSVGVITQGGSSLIHGFGIATFSPGPTRATSR